MPDRMLSRVMAVAANTYRETVRERVLYNLVLFAILMMGSGVLLRDLSINQDEKLLKDIALAAMEFFGTLIALFMGVTLVSKEIDKRSIHALLAKPVGRGEFVVGKFVGLSLTLLVNVTLMTLGLFGTLVLTGRRGDLHVLKAVFGIYLGLILIVAVALLFSTVTSSALAALGTICLIVAGRFSDVIRNAREVADVPHWLITALYMLIPNFRSLDLKDRVVYGDPISSAHLAWMALYAAAYTTVALCLAVAAFRARDFK
jgi:ABC-type transport system involved in multi-copper enzyme maturation permease subunit